MSFEEIFRKIASARGEKHEPSFLGFLKESLWALYDDYVMKKTTIAKAELDAWSPALPNAKEGTPYDLSVSLPEFSAKELSGVMARVQLIDGLNEATHGLSLRATDDARGFVISGTPCLDALRGEDSRTAPTTFDITLRITLDGIELPEDELPPLERHFVFIINPDPRKLWRNLPVDWENMPQPVYRKEDTDAQYVKVEAAGGTARKDIVAASKRGRSHAQEGKPRDDDFRVAHFAGDWYFMAVADGAGSAKFSREGSRIACEAALQHCRALLQDDKDLCENISLYHLSCKDHDESEARKIVGDNIYKIVAQAAFSAHKSILKEAASQGLPAKLYATTLLLAICKKFEFGWFVATFWVGDGAIGLYARDEGTIKILGVPDEGEYAGQTRFLTMPEIFSDQEAVYKRLRFQIVPDFTALMLMTDGVSDPKFETDENLSDPQKWDELWDDFKAGGVSLTDDNEQSKNQLLDWLDFWSAGNHDDRTIAILY